MIFKLTQRIKLILLKCRIHSSACDETMSPIRYGQIQTIDRIAEELANEKHLDPMINVIPSKSRH